MTLFPMEHLARARMEELRKRAPRPVRSKHPSAPLAEVTELPARPAPDEPCLCRAQTA